MVSQRSVSEAEVAMDRRIVITIFVAYVAFLTLLGAVLIGVSAVSPDESTNRGEPVSELTPGPVK